MALANKQLLVVSVGLAVQAAVLVLVNTFVAKVSPAGDLTNTAVSVMLYCAVGQIFGYITVFWRGKYEASPAT